MSTSVSPMPIALPDSEHQHHIPAPLISYLLDHTEQQAFHDRVIDMRPIRLALAAVAARCQSCQSRISAWMAHHGDPWTVMRLAGPVAADALRVARAVAIVPGAVPHIVGNVLRVAFDKDVAAVVTPIAVRDDVARVVTEWDALNRPRRYRVLQALLYGVAHRGPTYLGSR